MLLPAALSAAHAPPHTRKRHHELVPSEDVEALEEPRLPSLLYHGHGETSIEPATQIEEDRGHAVVFCPYFGRMPPWFPLTALSFAANPTITFVLVGDHFPRQGYHWNVAIERMNWSAFAAHVSTVFNVPLKWARECEGDHCGRVSKASDLKPYMGALFPQYLRGATWWGWMDMDLILGNIRAFLPSRADMLCPMWPNSINLVTWGPLTLFRTSALLAARYTNRTTAATTPFLLSRRWREVLQNRDHYAFEELTFRCGGPRARGPKCELGMSNVLPDRFCQRAPIRVDEMKTRQAWIGRRLRLDASGLSVDGQRTLLLHFAKVKEWSFPALPSGDAEPIGHRSLECAFARRELACASYYFH